jgi:hypothetical protein
MPSPFSTMGRRSVSNVPAQALILMNDPLVKQQAELWATRTLASPGTTSGRIERLFEEAFSRKPTVAEQHQIDAFLGTQAKQYGAGENDKRVWTDVCHVLFNMKEFIFLN